MKTYEITLVISSQLSSQEADDLKNKIEKEIQDKEGSLLKSEKSGAMTLSYPIKRQISGYFTTLECQISEEKIKEIKENIEKDSRILRHIILAKKPTRERREKRIRKTSNEYSATPSPFKKKTDSEKSVSLEKVDDVDLDKKLEEILSD